MPPITALLTVDYLENRGRRASRAAFERVLSRVPDVPPVRGDERESPVSETPRAMSRARQGLQVISAPPRFSRLTADPYGALPSASRLASSRYTPGTP
jgi:hypothetical protein